MNEQVGKNLDKSWARFSEQASLQKLERLGIKNIESAFKISSESDLNSNQIENEAEIYWVRFNPPSDFPNILPVEGKLYIPRNAKQNKTLIHYAPSFPQGNAGRFEKRYIYAFLKAGYSFFAGRHNGASLTKGETLDEIMNAPRRLEIAAKCGEQHIGGTRTDGYLPSEMNDEPIASLSALAGAFDEIHLVAQSLGASAHYNAVTKLKGHPEIMHKIRNIVSIAGYVGKDRKSDDNIWDGTKIPEQQFGAHQMDQIKRSDLNFKGDLEVFLSDMKKISEMNARIEVPPHVGNILFVTSKDPFIAGPRDSTPESLDDYGPATSRKLIISDERMETGDKRPHSMDWITSEDIIAAMEAEISEGHPQYRKLNPGESLIISP